MESTRIGAGLSPLVGFSDNAPLQLRLNVGTASCRRMPTPRIGFLPPDAYVGLSIPKNHPYRIATKYTYPQIGFVFSNKRRPACHSAPDSDTFKRADPTTALQTNHLPINWLRFFKLPLVTAS